MAEKPTDEKVYYSIEFALAEQLRGKAKEIAYANGIKNGMVAIMAKAGSPVDFEVVAVEGSPTEFIRKLAKEEKIDEALKKMYMI